MREEIKFHSMILRGLRARGQSSSSTVTGRIPSLRSCGSSSSRALRVSRRAWHRRTAWPRSFARAMAAAHWRRISSGRPSSSRKTSRRVAGTPACSMAMSPTVPAEVTLSTKKNPFPLSACAKAAIAARSEVNADPMWLLAPFAWGTSAGHPGEPVRDLLRRHPPAKEERLRSVGDCAFRLHRDVEDHAEAVGSGGSGERFRGGAVR